MRAMKRRFASRERARGLTAAVGDLIATMTEPQSTGVGQTRHAQFHKAVRPIASPDQAGGMTTCPLQNEGDLVALTAGEDGEPRDARENEAQHRAKFSRLRPVFSWRSLPSKSSPARSRPGG